jgi:hypothetical protein
MMPFWKYSKEKKELLIAIATASVLTAVIVIPLF